MTRLINKAGWIVAGVLALLVVATITGVVFGGPLNPPVSVGTPTGKIQINALPFTISAPGSYIVNADLVCTTCTAGQSGITIASSAVTLDLQGFALRGVSGSDFGIIVSPTHYDLEIRNGLVTGWDGAGIDMGAAGSAPNSRVEDMRVSGNNGNGIMCTNGDVVEHNIVAGNHIRGIYAVDGCEVTSNTISGNGYWGINTVGNTNTVTDNVVTGNNTSGGSEAILIDSPGNNNRIDGNRIDANGNLGITVKGSFNTLTRNFVCNWALVSFNYVGTNNTFGPTQNGPGALGANPWANISCQ